MLRILASTVACLLCCAACGGAPTEPRDALAAGLWAGDGGCLAVNGQICDLAVGCGHGQFPRPTVRADGTFTVDGSYRIEAGPITIDPPPPAKFSGVVTGGKMVLTVVPSGTSLPPASYTLQLSKGFGTCPVRCL